MPDGLRKLAGVSWAEMPESVACGTLIYGFLCSFLSERYVISVGAYKGKMLSVKSALGCLGGLIVQAEAKWSGKCSPEYQDFWHCTKSTNHAKAIWYKGLRVNLQRVIFQRMLDYAPSGLGCNHTACGELVDEAALAEALKSGQLGAAALDVHWSEPYTSGSGPLAGAPNLWCTPHSAWYSPESRADMRQKGALTALKALRGVTAREADWRATGTAPTPQVHNSEPDCAAQLVWCEHRQHIGR